jgi:hypothetical protein
MYADDALEFDCNAMMLSYIFDQSWRSSITMPFGFDLKQLRDVMNKIVACLVLELNYRRSCDEPALITVSFLTG